MRADQEARRAVPGGGSTFATVVLVGALSGLCSCSVGPNFKTPEMVVNQAWSAASDPRVAAQAATDSLWWKTFNDPGLDRLVEVAYRQNLPLQIAGLRIAEARAQLGVATGLQFPQTQELFGSAILKRISDNSAEALTLPVTHIGDFQLGFDAAWELDFWGKYRRGVETETAALLATVADYYAALVSLMAEVARTYVAIRTFEVLLAQARANAKIQEDALDIATSRFRNGATSELDPTQATTLLESTRSTIPRFQTSLQQARNALSTLLGQPPGSIEGLLVGPQEIPKAATKVAVGVPAEVLRRRPDIRSAEMMAAAQCARIGIAKAELYPSFSLLGTIGLRTFATSESSHTFFSSHSVFYAVGPQFHLPIFNYGRLLNGVRIEDARFQQLLVNYRDVVVKATQEVEDALVGFLRAQEAAVFEQNAVAAAQRSVELSFVAYREGATDYQRVIDAERSLLQEQNSLAQSSSAVATNLIALYKSLGGGWQTRQPPPPAQH